MVNAGFDDLGRAQHAFGPWLFFGHAKIPEEKCVKRFSTMVESLKASGMFRAVYLSTYFARILRTEIQILKRFD